MESLLHHRIRATLHPVALIHFICSVTGCLLLLLTTSCITEDVPQDNMRGNFEACWQQLDRRYCFFDQKKEEYGLDWNEVYQRYSPSVNEEMTERQMFELLSNMICELRDGHVNLSAAHDVARYGKWYDDYPANYSDSLERIYLGRTEEYQTASGLKYRILDDNIGYIRCSTFSNDFGDGNLHEIMRYLALCEGLIIDVRNNGGGMITAAQHLASLFFNEKTCVGYFSHKSGPGHNDFSAPIPIEIEPFTGLRWQKGVAVLTNRRTYSAANAFVMYMKEAQQATIIGDITGGGGGMPLNTELPNGWTLRFSACPSYTTAMKHIESGIQPDIKVDLLPNYLLTGRDNIIEMARLHLKQKQ